MVQIKQSNPEAFLSIDKNRQKIYPNNTLYLQDNKEFQFELFNPTTDNILVKILINGNSISDTGLILKPGMRTWLDRYIDEDRKFQFQTYKIENSASARAATENNGSIEIQFFKEKIQNNNWNFNDLWKDNQWPYKDKIYGPIYDQYRTNGIGGNMKYCCDSNNVIGASNNVFNCSGTLNEVSNDIETGRIEKGSKSNQEFESVYMDFEIFSFHNIKYKLIPISQKQYVTYDELKSYCTDCGLRIKKSTWKFCPKCGNSLK